MNRVLSSIAVMVLCFVLRVDAGTYAYTNNTTVEMGAAPTIDATNFLNNGQFLVTTNLYSGDYYFYNVLNYTNRNLMSANYGFTFDRTPAEGGPIRMANNFVNASLVTETNCRIYGGADINISATNVINKGVIEAGSDKITIKGQNVDLSRGTLRLTAAANANASLSQQSQFDSYWGINDIVDFNNLLTTTLSIFSNPSLNNQFWWANGSAVVTHLVGGLGGFYATNTSVLTLTNTLSYVYTNQTDPSNVFNTIVFVQNANPGVKVDTRFVPGAQFGTPVVQLSNTVTSSSGLVTNLIYITDRLGNNKVQLLQDTFVTIKPSFHPDNYSISYFDPGFGFMSPSNAVPPFSFAHPTNGLSTAYQVKISEKNFDPAYLSLGSSIANQPGRIEVRANNLTMNNAHIDAINYLVLQATNHFSGSSNSVVTVPYSDISLSSTNGTLSITNVLAPSVPRIVGTISLWSGRWTNVDFAGVTNFYNVLLVDSQLDPVFPSKVNNLSLNASNTFLSDTMNVQSNLLMTAQKLTITTNILAGVGGELNIQTPAISVSDAFPNLQYFTNYGRFSTIGDSYFGVPLSLQAFVNRGGIDVEGISVNTAVFENKGIILAKSAGCYLQAAYAGITNGSTISQNGDVSLKSDVLCLNGSTIFSAHSLSLDVSQKLDDLGVNSSWECHDGFNFLAHPASGDLFGTTLANVAFDNAQTISSSAIADRGPSPANFTNSATIGHLVLDGGVNSQFVFTGTGDSKALYIDYLELKNSATNPGSLFIDNNITLYVAAAGPISPEKLSLIYPRLVWVPGFQGPNSTTNIMLRNGQTIAVNSSLVGSATLDSDGDGVPNSIDPYPFDGLQISAVTNAGPQTVTISWFADSASWEYDIDYSTDLITWTPLTSVFSGPAAGQLMTFQDSLSSGVHRYYRVRTLSH